ncbi:hypothetical protein CALVIDRAFT_568711 [Calocera viscosa TUFC12733]|uniref:Uncharacterized protein n=1 Tax=Calocera viscosa (strain TUFC12733) TaxID=1330018 RepID=A0A167GRI0_CALVF|nr:hypothetical protein CALVIDRAFT_568711 [Calocera viscosa TUFC12733]
MHRKAMHLSLLRIFSMRPLRRVLLPLAAAFSLFLVHQISIQRGWELHHTVGQWSVDRWEKPHQWGLPSTRPFLSPSSPKLKQPSQEEVLASLSQLNRYREDLPFSTPLRSSTSLSSAWGTTDVEMMELGMDLWTIALDTRMLERGDGTEKSFNPALLKLPSGLEWDFALVARGTSRRHPEMEKMNRKLPIEQGLIAFGANMSSSYRLHQVSPAFYLPLPSKPTTNCKGSSHVFGAEDPRIWWSDANVPMLSYTQIATDPSLCRAIAWIPDLRAVWPKLDRVLKRSLLVPPQLPTSNKDGAVQLAKVNAHSIEKNWMSFYPGALPDPTQAPAFHYQLDPQMALQQAADQPFDGERLRFEPMWNEPPEQSDVCTKYHQFPWRAAHQSFPLQRLTLCPRGTCIPDETNTVFLSMGQRQTFRKKGKATQYGRFVMTWNVTSPFEFVSMHPEFHFAGTDDEGIVYAISSVFLPTTTTESDPHQPPLNLGHGFIDDNAMIGLGIADRYMSTIVIPVGDLLSGGKLCRDAFQLE